MPILFAGQELQTQYWEPVARGPVAQADLSAWSGLSASGPPVTIPNASSYQSGVIVNGGFVAIGIGAKSTNTGVITVQRYLDRGGTVPVGAPITANLVAATSNWVTVDDGVPFASFTFTISNTGAGSATISNFGCLLSAG